MDIYCKRCGEPWELDVLHEIADEEGITYDMARVNFLSAGCAAVPFAGECEPRETLRGLATEVLGELLGDDVDGLAATLDDFDYAGMLD